MPLMFCCRSKCLVGFKKALKLIAFDARRLGSRSSISFRNGEPWQHASAGYRGSGAALNSSIVSIEICEKPALSGSYAEATCPCPIRPQT